MTKEDFFAILEKCSGKTPNGDLTLTAAQMDRRRYDFFPSPRGPCGNDRKTLGS